MIKPEKNICETSICSISRHCACKKRSKSSNLNVINEQLDLVCLSLVKRTLKLGEKDLNTPFTSLSNRNVQQYLLSFLFVVELRFWYAQKWPIVSPMHDFLYPHRISYLSLLLCQMLTVDFRHFCDKQDKKKKKHSTDKLNESNLATGVIFAGKTMNKKTVFETWG